eukprot:TRINITY_DN13682_c0_g1_i5.p1 TRINITY_DN13682_c0_g1~~TRINITY_DN13682_c0_g1_i5.p1  ORF type:complete len:206 (-),score=47.46 TRINITY_DN13682_c0_g1_i5:11-628(-)
MDAASCYSSCRERGKSVAWKNGSELHRLLSGPHPVQHKNRRYMFKILRTDFPPEAKHRVAVKYSTRGKSSGLRGVETPLEVYERALKPRRAANGSEKSYLLCTNQPPNAKRVHRKHNTAFNGSFVYENRAFETVDRQGSLQNSLIVREGSIRRNKRYQFHTTQRVKKKDKSTSLLEQGKEQLLSLIHICRCRRYAVCRSRWSPYH